MAGSNPNEIPTIRSASMNVGPLSASVEVNVLGISDALAVVCDGVTNKPGDAVANDVRSFTLEATERLLIEIDDRRRSARDFLSTLDVAEAVVRNELVSASSFTTTGDSAPAGYMVDEIRKAHADAKMATPEKSSIGEALDRASEAMRR